MSCHYVRCLYMFVPFTFDYFDDVWSHSLKLVVTRRPNCLPSFAVANGLDWMEVDLVVADDVASCYDGAVAVDDFVHAVVQLHYSSFAASWQVKIPASVPCLEARTLPFW